MLTRICEGTHHRIPGSTAMAMVLVAASFCLAGSAVQAQDGSVRDWNDTLDTLEGGIGLHYGQLGGHGLSFRLPLEWWLYFQVSGGIWHTADQKQHNLGLQANYILRQDQRTRIFIAAGLAYFYDDEQVRTDVWVTEKNWNYGAGVGMEYLMGQRWSLQVEGDFARLGSSGDIKVIPQVGIYYYW